MAFGVHALAFLVLLVGLGRLPEASDMTEIAIPTTLVFRMEIGPGGGGGGGGERSPEPASVRTIEGEDAVGQAFDPEQEPLVFTPEEPPKDASETAQPDIDAPFVARAPDEADQIGVVESEDRESPASAGPGTGGGSGTGTGTGSGAAAGSGVGEGTGGGFGGGAHRLGAGIEPPLVIRSVEPNYTQDALRRKIEGDVVLEVVILEDGRVADVRVVQGLDPGLDQNAIAAALKWRFVPGKMQGQAVAVIAEIVMEFRLL